MQTRRDLYQAHRLMLQRVGMALLAGEPDLPEPPTRRLNVSIIAGLMVGVLVVAGFGIYGLISPGGATGLTDAGTLIIEKETGTKFVYSQQDEKMYPVANYSSARLILAEANLKRKVVSQASLAKFTRGAPVGIPNAPDSLPDAKHQTRGPWSICAGTMQTVKGTPRTFSSLVVGRPVGGRTLGDTEAVVVRGAGDSWVIWRNQRMKLQQGQTVGGPDQPADVPMAWLNSVPPGPDFKAPLIPDRGREITGPGGTKAAVGTLYSVRSIGGGTRWYVLMADGLAQIKQTEADLLQNDANSKAAYKNGDVRLIPLDPATANSAPHSTVKVSVAGLPDAMPKITAYQASSPVCVTYADSNKGEGNARVALGGTVPELSTTSASASTPATTSSASLVDQVILPPGDGVLVGLLPGPNQTSAVNTFAVLTDQGQRYAVSSMEIAGQLGFDAKKVALVPGNLLHLIPEGPALDPARARQPVASSRSTG